MIVPAFVLGGYFVRVTRAAGEGRPEPPTFEDWGDMAVDGLGLFLVLLPVYAVWAVAAFVTVEIHLALYLATTLPFGYMIPALYINYAMNDGWAAAYNLSDLRTLLTDRTYVIGYLTLVFVVNLLGAIVVTILLGLSLLTILGWIILWPTIFFYWIAIDASLLGRVYNRIAAA